MTIKQAIENAMNECIDAIKSETQYSETDNTIAEVKYFQGKVQTILQDYDVLFLSKHVPTNKEILRDKAREEYIETLNKINRM